jgi:uncharacterized protein
MEHFDWPPVDRFLNRSAELLRLQEWHDEDNPMPLAVYGRRRVGKSWLLRRFVHGRPGIVLVAERLSEGMQLDRFAQQLSGAVGIVPRIDDAPDLIRVLLRLGHDQPITVVIDEFPYLLPSTTNETDRVLSQIQAVLEEDAGRSKTRLIISGSIVSQMTSLFAERNPLHGRLRPFELAPLSFAEARPFLETLDPIDRFERYAVCGGAARYLSLLGSGPLASTLARQVLDQNAPLWNEGRAVVEQELRQPGVYFSILEILSSGDKEMNELVQAVRSEPSVVTKYLDTLRQMRLVTRVLPVGAAASSRQSNWHLADPFLQFWFRFVFPNQADLESGLSGASLFENEIKPALSQHVSHHFEDWCRHWLRQQGQVTNVGAWWGPALNSLRKSGERSTEEIDIVGLSRGSVAAIGEAKWTHRVMPRSVLDDLLMFKIPALEQSGMKVAADFPIWLFSRSGYDRGLLAAAADDPRIRLVDVAHALDGAQSD